MKKKKVWAYCYDGPCQGKVFEIEPDQRELIIPTPEDPVYKRVCYRLTDQSLILGEYVAVFKDGIKWK